MLVVLQWYYNDRDGKALFPELSNVFGPFSNKDIADKWVASASSWGGWGRYEYQIENLQPPVENENGEQT
jgi:hypothetical protein